MGLTRTPLGARSWLFFLFTLFILPISCCTYEKEPTEWVQYSSAVPSPNGTELAYLRYYKKYRKPTGLNRFPDGGQAKMLQEELALYCYHRRDGSSEKLAPVAGQPGNPPSVILSWKEDTLVYWLYSTYNRNHVPPVSWAKNRGIFCVDLQSGQQRQLVDFGESPELSPDATQAAFLKRTGESSQELWLASLGGSEPRLLKDLEGRKINWIEWPEPGTLYLYSSLSEKTVYRFDLDSGELTPAPAHRPYHSFPPQIPRGKLKELLQKGND